MKNRCKEFVLVYSERQYRDKRHYMEMLTKLCAAETLHHLGFDVLDQQVEWVQQPAFLADVHPKWACRVINFVSDELEMSVHG